MKYKTHVVTIVANLLITLMFAIPQGKANPSTGPVDPLVLENAQLSISIDRHTAGVTEVGNKLTGKTYRIDDPGFLIELGTGKEPGTLGQIRPQDCSVEEASVSDGEARVVFSRGSVKITVNYQLGSQDHFAVKRVKVGYSGNKTYNVSRLEMFNWYTKPTPSKAIPYYGFLYGSNNLVEEDDRQAPSPNSVAFFMRYAEGGIFTAISSDFALMYEDEKTGRYHSKYWPGQILKDGETLESERGLIGVYRRKGPFHTPYKRTEKLDDFLLPNVDVRLDRAEIEGVQTAIQKFLKPGRHTFVANGWAMGLPGQIRSRKATEQFKAAVDAANRFPKSDGIHFIGNFGGLSREFRKHGLDTPPKLNPFVREAYAYAEKKNTGISAFVWSSRAQLKPKDSSLNTLRSQGTRRANNLAFTERYSDFIVETFSSLGETYPNIMGLSFDFLFLRPDYDPNHGYLPGIGSLYAQWANVRNTLRRLHQQHPEWMLRTQMGWRHLSPWLAEHSSFVHNSLDPNIFWQRNFLDSHASYQYANNLRLASWFAANTKMFPRYMMNSFIVHKNTDYKAWDYGAWRYSVLSRIMAGTGFGMLNGTPDFEGGEVFPEEQAAFLEKWMKWQRERKEYYQRGTSLFGEPRPTGVDGMAYGNGEDAIVFLANPTFETREVSVPISSTVHLPEGGRYMVKELYPEERYRIGLDEGGFDYGTQFVVKVPPQTISVFEVKPLQPERPYLLGIEGAIKQSNKKLAIDDVSGPTGRTRQFAVRLPESWKTSAPVPEVRIEGQDVPMKREGRTLLGRIQFAGDPIDPEISDWMVRKKGERSVLSTEFFVPEGAREVLAGQALPVTKKYRDQEEILNKTAWLDWSRFIIHLPVLPKGAMPKNTPFRWEGANVDEGDQFAGFRPKAFLNGKQTEVHSNIMEGHKGSKRRKRWSGFFLDASDSIDYGEQNTLRLEFPEGAELGYFAAYLTNLRPKKTREWEVLAPPEELLVEERPGAANAYPPVPVIQREDNDLTLYLKVSISGRIAAEFAADEITVEDGTLYKVARLEPTRHMASGDSTLIKLADGTERTCVRFRVEGTEETRVHLGENLETFTLGKVLKEWRSRGDRYASLALTLPGADGGSTITVELVGSATEKIAVRNPLSP